jgi:hypothetical protein
MSFPVPETYVPASIDLPAHLGYDAPVLVRGGLIVEVVLWLGAVAFVWRDRRQRGRSAQKEQPDPAWFEPIAVVPSPRPRRTERTDLLGPDGDDAWSDV